MSDVHPIDVTVDGSAGRHGPVLQCILCNKTTNGLDLVPILPKVANIVLQIFVRKSYKYV
jgi:hypothetical protein